jgi:phosphatidylserine/phosphatidylglycerophosphate/cardiolipin synthase-like enzyme
MKPIPTALLLILSLGFFQLLPAQSAPNIELVESIPIGTNLDNPDIPDAHDVWLAMIHSATKTLDIEQFYISNKQGEMLDNVIGAIIDASKRDVTVRLIADARMYKTYPETIDSLGKINNIHIRIIDFGKLAGGIQHAKYFIVDGTNIFLGSQNFDWRALNQIHELGIRLRHAEAVKIYQDIFNLDWELAEKNDKSSVTRIFHPETYRIPCTIIPSPADTVIFTPTMSPKCIIPDSTLWDEKQMVDLIDQATKEVVCQALTYSPVGRNKEFYPALDNALRRAAVRGVKVKMIVSDWSTDHPTIDHLKSLSIIPNIEIKVSSIPDWSGGYIPYGRVEHCKYIVSDGTACWIGTSNLEKSYFYTCRNLGIIIQSGKIPRQVQSIFEKSWNGEYTHLIKPNEEYPPRKHGE